MCSSDTGCDLSHSLLHLFYTYTRIPSRGMCDLEPVVALTLTIDCMRDLMVNLCVKDGYDAKIALVDRGEGDSFWGNWPK